MRRLRYLPPGGALVEVTCRTIQGRFFLDPDPSLNEIVLGVLGRAQRLYSMRVCAFAFLSNHFHLLLDVEDSLQLSRFMGYLNSNLAREVGRLAKWRARFWAQRYQAIFISCEEAAQVDRIRYVLAQGTKERIVSTPRDWPGAHCAKALLDGQSIEGLWIDRTSEYKARQRRQEVDPGRFQIVEHLTLSPIPAWKNLTPAAYRAQIAEVVAQIETDCGSSAPKGATKARREPGKTSPSRHHRPKAIAISPAPLCHAATEQVRREFRNAYRWFFSAFRAAAERLIRGEPRPPFPIGSFPPGLPFVRD